MPIERDDHRQQQHHVEQVQDRVELRDLRVLELCLVLHLHRWVRLQDALDGGACLFGGCVGCLPNSYQCIGLVDVVLLIRPQRQEVRPRRWTDPRS